jgi:hypothetical protein
MGILPRCRSGSSEVLYALLALFCTILHCFALFSRFFLTLENLTLKGCSSELPVSKPCRSASSPSGIFLSGNSDTIISLLCSIKLFFNEDGEGKYISEGQCPTHLPLDHLSNHNHHAKSIPSTKSFNNSPNNLLNFPNQSKWFPSLPSPQSPSLPLWV